MLRVLLILVCCLELVGCQPHMPLLVTDHFHTASTTPTPKSCQNLEEHYQRCRDADGIPIIGSNRISHSAFKAAHKALDLMVPPGSAYRKKMTENKLRIAIIDREEKGQHLPGLLHMTLFSGVFDPGGGSDFLGFFNYVVPAAYPIVVVPESDLVCDDYASYAYYEGFDLSQGTVIAHELAHAIHWTALRSLDSTFSSRLVKAYNHSVLEKGLWKDTYAATNAEEYWAEGLEGWFTKKGDWKIDTRNYNDLSHPANDPLLFQESPVEYDIPIRKYDPQLFQLLQETFPNPQWDSLCSRDFSSSDLKHLTTSNPIHVQKLDDNSFQLTLKGEGFFKVQNHNGYAYPDPFPPSEPELKKPKQPHFHTYEYIDIAPQPKPKQMNNLYKKSITLLWNKVKEGLPGNHITIKHNGQSWMNLFSNAHLYLQNYQTVKDITSNGEVIVHDNILNQSYGIGYIPIHYFREKQFLKQIQPGLYQETELSNSPTTHTPDPTIDKAKLKDLKISMDITRDNDIWRFKVTHPQAYFNLYRYDPPLPAPPSNEIDFNAPPEMAKEHTQIYTKEVEMKLIEELDPFNHYSYPEIPDKPRKTYHLTTLDEKYQFGNVGRLYDVVLKDICSDGRMLVLFPETKKPQTYTRVDLYLFPEPEHLREVQEGKYIETSRSGRAHTFRNNEQYEPGKAYDTCD